MEEFLDIVLLQGLKRPAIHGNVVEDFAVGENTRSASILAALINIQKGGSGQLIVLGMAQGAAYLSQFILHQKNEELWSKGIGNNVWRNSFLQYLLIKGWKINESGEFRRKILQEFIKGLILDDISQQRGQFSLENQLNSNEWENLKSEISKIFESKTITCSRFGGI